MVEEDVGRVRYLELPPARICGVEFGVEGAGLRVWGLGLRVEG